jgi:hypothetical protein
VSRQDGDIYEIQAEHICRALGYQVIRPTAGNQHSWDRLVNGRRLQIKKRCVDQSKPNNIRLVTNLSSSAVVYDSAEVDAFAIFWRDEWFVFPAAAIADAEGKIHNGVYMPELFSYSGRWDVLAGSRVPHEVQAVLF